MNLILEYILRGILKLYGILPLGFHYFNARILAFLAGDVLRYRHNEVMVNLARSFPEKKYEELEQIGRMFYRHFAEVLVEAVWFGASSASRLERQRIVRMANPEVLRKAYDSASGVVVLTGHCGNWELVGGIAGYDFGKEPGLVNEGNMCVVYKRLSSGIWDRIMRDMRKAPLQNPGKYEGYLESRDVVRYVFRHNAEKKFYLVITDQSPYSDSRANVDVEFMHQRTKTMTAAASLAVKFGMAAVYMGMKREGRGHYVMEFTTISPDASKTDAAAVMKEYYSLLESDIEAQPENYLWTHRRWKAVE